MNKTSRIEIKVTKEEKQELKKLALKFTGGNISALIRLRCLEKENKK